jgi:GntP family gluconate:H+ symporter
VFFEVGFVLLVPIAFNVAKRTGTNMVLVGIPGGRPVGGARSDSAAPGRAAGGDRLRRRHRSTILYALIVVPTAIIAGPLFAKLISKVVIPDPDNPLISQFVDSKKDRELPGFGITSSPSCCRWPDADRAGPTCSSRPRPSPMTSCA